MEHPKSKPTGHFTVPTGHPVYGDLTIIRLSFKQILLYLCALSHIIAHTMSMSLAFVFDIDSSPE